MNKMMKRFVAALLALTIVFTVPVFAEDNLKYIPESDEAKFFNMVASDLIQLYQFDITKDQLLTRTLTNLLNSDPEALDSFLRALFNSLDPYSEFYTPEEYEEMMQSLENVTGGIGVQMTKGAQYVEVVNVLEGSTALEAGVQVGDKIVKVDGENMVGKGTEYISNKIKGEIGTDVVLTVQRGNETLDITVTRGQLVDKTVEYGLVGEDVGYLYILSFSSATDSEVAQALAEFDSLGITKIILDLRNNPGGYVDTAVNVAKYIVPEGTIVTHYTKYNDYTEEYRSDLKETKYELVTLVNEYTASAAEILASALQDSGASKLIGKQTYGKAVTQAMLGLYGGRMCKVTSGEYITRNGKKINNIGIIPDKTVSNRVLPFEQTNAGTMKYAPSYQEGDIDEGIYLAKLRLEVLGYDAGVRNEEFDEAMKYAVMAYQEDKGLEATGVLDINTQICMEGDVSGLEVLIDNQAAAAFDYFGLTYTGFMAGGVK